MTQPDFPFTTDGCSMFPDGNWGGCCVEHDKAYWKGGTEVERFVADIALANCIAYKTKMPFLALLMLIGVRIGGVPWLPTPWRWGYGWKFSKSQTYKKQRYLT